MHFLQAFVALSALAAPALSTPLNSTLTPRQHLFPNQPQCGVTNDAVASDCRSLVDGPIGSLNFGRTCHYGGGVEAYNPICSPGNCCFYTTSSTASIDDVHKYGDLILGCEDNAVNKVNGRVVDENNNMYCLSDGGGCGDCFYSIN